MALRLVTMGAALQQDSVTTHMIFINTARLIRMLTTRVLMDIMPIEGYIKSNIV